MYCFFYLFLKDDLGISNFDDIDFCKLQVFGNGGGLLFYDVNIDCLEDLVENVVCIVGEEDGSFDSGDYILMYVEGFNKWCYDEEND